MINDHNDHIDIFKLYNVLADFTIGGKITPHSYIQILSAFFWLMQILG